ncbi:GNAT family N-acetyltransferase [Colwellia sp. Bg11-12]|jgi:N-acetylglutamate synthase-like GNAT family acetyltransferase|uniref:GNAT family N-acetyltransferase n=1 Tax=Colwellia sp. Bg11-12 TaxID=2759817 RepID=UPI0015F5AF48|nr:GNAT family N-acetyltransferase [Colwellia sp. Bg11-12]MBA6265666.1 GNAT family N-acetyltransferase [Colwellia sp. Bg11-12]
MQITIVTATKSDKKSLMRFYKQQHYSAGLLGFDHTYLIKSSSEIIGSVIVSAIIENNQQLFLHALVIKQAHRQKKLATKLIQHVLLQHYHQNIFCFANETLRYFYHLNGFSQIAQSQLDQLLLKRYLGIKKTNSTLLVFQRKLLSHKNEQ